MGRLANDREVMLELNTTPLIDVLLVLLVMLIITIPLQSHAVKLDLPNGPPSVTIDPIKNVLSIAPDGGTAWNGQPVDRTNLRDLLDRTATAPRPAELHLAPAPQAPYGVVDDVLAMTKRARLTRVGFVGNEAYRSF